MSTTEVFNNTEIINAKIAAFAAFQKKSSFGPASIYIRNSTISKSKKISLIQEGSTGWNNNELLKTSQFNTNDFYKNPDLSKINSK